MEKTVEETRGSKYTEQAIEDGEKLIKQAKTKANKLEKFGMKITPETYSRPAVEKELEQALISPIIAGISQYPHTLKT